MMKFEELMNVETLGDFLPLNLEASVWDSETDELGIALVGPTYLTPEGEKEFLDILDLPIELEVINDILHVTVDVDGGEEWKYRQRKLRDFLKSAAGYCSEEKYNLWFKEV